jgi:hypothetical protein
MWDASAALSLCALRLLAHQAVRRMDQECLALVAAGVPEDQAGRAVYPWFDRNQESSELDLLARWYIINAPRRLARLGVPRV